MQQLIIRHLYQFASCVEFLKAFFEKKRAPSWRQANSSPKNNSDFLLFVLPIKTTELRV